MSDPSWGRKQKCAACGAAFYDMRRTPIACPKCGALHQPVALLKSDGRPPRTSRSRSRAPAAAEPVPVAAEADSDAAPRETEDEDEEALEDAAELDGENDDATADESDEETPER